MQIENEPLVSVLIAAYNAEKYIESSVNSVLNQTYTNYEILIIDDGSKDKTYQILKKLELENEKIRVFQNNQNQGIAITRNKLKKLANGKYFMWQDADDISLPDRMGLQVNVMEEDDSIGMVGGFLEVFNHTNSTYIRKYPKDDKEIKKKIFRYCTLSEPAAMFRKSVSNMVGEFDDSLTPSADYDMLFRIAGVSKLSNVQKVVIKYRESSNNSTFSNLKKMEFITISIRLKYSSKLNMTNTDHFYNIAHYLSIFLIPRKFKVYLFNILRSFY